MGPERRPQVYDCFLFWKECDLLVLRLQELQQVVDYFVLVEASRNDSRTSCTDDVGLNDGAWGDRATLICVISQA